MKQILFFISIVCAFGLVSCNNNGAPKELSTEEKLDSALKLIDKNTKVDLGKWEVDYFTDEFGDTIDVGYIKTYTYGTFSSYAAEDEKAALMCFADKQAIAFRFSDYGKYVVKDDGTYIFNIKDSDGEVSSFLLFNSKDGYMTVRSNDNDSLDYKKIYDILSKGGIVSISAKQQYSQTTRKHYTFKLEADGFKKAMSLFKE